jgi:adenosylcobinamide hydrolase
MRYFLLESTLLVRGSFRATGPGAAGAVIPVPTLLAHALAERSGPQPAAKALELAAAAAGCGRDYAGLVTTVPLQDLCVLQHDFLTVFIAAAFLQGRAGGAGAATTAVIICSGQGMSDAALHEAAGTAAGAVSDSLTAGGWAPAGSPADTIIVACEGRTEHPTAGPESPVGSRIRDSLRFGLPEALRRSTGPLSDRPAFFIFSRFKGDHWVEWVPEECPYYPCHFDGQRCDYCYCPLYPCGDETLGQWTTSSNGGRVWNCSSCTMIHEPAVADYLKRYPEASKDELLRVRKRRQK